EDVIDVHYQYYMAGSNLVCSNTFGAFITKFPLNIERIITAAIDNINEARKRAFEELKKINPSEEPELYVAFDISTTGKLLKPMGDLDFEDCITLYKKTFRIAFAQKVDCVLIETMNDGYETKAAVIAAKEIMEELKVELPILVSNVYDADCRTLSGSTPETMVAMMEGLGISAIGTNCSLGPKQMENTINRLLDCAHIPVLVKPNAGLPRVVDGKTVFDVAPEEFVETMNEIIRKGAALAGGCCGTNPEYIKLLKEANKEQKLYAVSKENAGGQTSDETCHGVISSNTKTVHFGKNFRPVLIGERINPTGKKKFKEALRNNDISYIIHQGIEQEQAGAMALDVNVGLPEIDEKEMMLSVMSELQAVTDLPLQIDTTNPEVMEAALRRYNGKAMINSVNGKKEIMEQIFPLVKKYGGLVVALTLDEDGIPDNSKKRIEIAKKIYAEAEKYGISKHDIIIDPLAMAVSSDSQAGLATLETVKAISEMGGLTSLGISNVSFGLPNREFVTSAFFNMAMTNGLSAAIMNPLQQEMIKTYKCYCLLKGMDENCTEYIEWASNIQAVALTGGGSLPLGSAPAGSSPTPSSGDSPRNAPGDSPESPLSAAIAKGLKEDAANETKKLLETTDSLEIINNHLIPGLDYVGKRFEQKTMYLPQLLMAAEAAKFAFGEIRSNMEKSGKKGNPKGKIIIATVKGDIHDIGKNIVKVLLENYDFEVIDLGKDVPPETIVEACKKDKVQLVGLSALMTTTVPAMEETIKLLRKECPWTKVCVGGAVLTQEYANMIGADFYGKDAMDTVRYANEAFS
ncbi:MAG: homocysteine S-methyltransferase family protein, partial [Treponema sp.]|nr:homocysteine S-methyltransferase family protein [Treponema sp.]